jgi:hypothetical protein
MVLRPKTKDDEVKLFDNYKIKSVVPLDEYLGLNKLPFKITIGAMLEIAYWVQRSHSYEDAEEGLKKYTKIIANNDTIRFVANEIGKIIFDIEYKKAEEAFKRFTSGEVKFPTKKIDHDLYIETDGAMFHSRQKDEDGHTWKENKLGMVFCSDTFYRWRDKKTGERQKKIGIREYTAYVGKIEIFQKFLLACALRNGYGNHRNTILLSDGAPWIKNMKSLLFADTIHILDFFHLSENVSTFAKQYFNNDEDKYKPWVDEVKILLKESKYKTVINDLEKLDKRKLRKCKFSLKQYIINNQNSIDYKSYESNDWFIGSGAIESGNKTVLQERLKQAGMRWNIQTAQFIVTLMTKAKSHLWESDVVKLILQHFGVENIF